MKKIVVSVVGAVAFVAVVVFNINAGISNDSDVTLANVEALATGEGGAGNYWCCSPYNIECAVGDGVTICGHIKTMECP